MSAFEIRPARRSDSRMIAEYYVIASDGVSAYVWQQLAEPGEDLIDVGSRRYERENTAVSYQNTLVVENNGKAIGMLVAYPMIIVPDYVETDPILRPYSVLEEPDSYYVAAMAVSEDARGHGIGSTLLARAEATSKELGLSKLSLIVFEKNVGARRLYERNGFIETAREVVVPHPLIHLDGDALLMVKDLDS